MERIEGMYGGSIKLPRPMMNFTNLTKYQDIMEHNELYEIV
jgi:hypothetical protein